MTKVTGHYRTNPVTGKQEWVGAHDRQTKQGASVSPVNALASKIPTKISGEQVPQPGSQTVSDVFANYQNAILEKPVATLESETPTMVDTKAAAAWEELGRARQRLDFDREQIYPASGVWERYMRKPPFQEALNAAIARTKEAPSPYEKHVAKEAVKAYDDALEKVEEKWVEYEKHDNEWKRRGRWSRAFLAVGGHVHSSMNCSTCNNGAQPTSFSWMTEYSGESEKNIVSAAGERACTICYPTAPVETLNSPTRMFSEQELIAAKEKERRASAAAIKKAETLEKSITNPDVSKLVVDLFNGYRETVKTERAARILLARELAAQEVEYSTDWRHNRGVLPLNEQGLENKRRSLRKIEILSIAIAAKNGITVKEVLSDAKILKSVRKQVKENI